MNDIISIVVPIYNVEQYLIKCVNSIINQTYKNLQIILVDDGSTDNSGKIADELMRKDKRIITVHKKNGGLSDARNYGLNIAKGKYICFIDSDDYINVDMISILYNDIKKYNVRISAISYKEVCEYNDTEIKTVLNGKVEVLNKKEALKSLFTNSKVCNFAWNKMYDIMLFDNIKYPVGKKMEDLATTYLLIDKCEKITFNNAKAYYYLQRSESILHNKDERLINDKIELAIRRYCYFDSKYPEIEENYTYILNLIIDNYRYTNNSELKEKMKKILKDVKKSKDTMKRVSMKYKIKYMLLKICKIIK